MSKPETIKIDEVEYVRKDSIQEQKELGDYFIVRTYSAGVFFGNITHRDGKEVTMTNARRLWMWAGAASLSQLSIDGTANPKECKFPEAMRDVTLTEVIEIIRCTKKAIESIKGVPVWKA